RSLRLDADRAVRRGVVDRRAARRVVSTTASRRGGSQRGDGATGERALGPRVHSIGHGIDISRWRAGRAVLHSNCKGGTMSSFATDVMMGVLAAELVKHAVRFILAAVRDRSERA